MLTAIKIRDINKKYGNLQALDNINLDIKKGEFFGLLGPNGAGKSTLIGILGGVFYSVKGLPGIWSRVSLFNPVFYMVDTVRYAFIGQSDIKPLFSALIIGILAIVLLLLVTYLFKIGYKVKS